MVELKSLPEDILVQITSYLAPQSYLNFCAVSKDIHAAFNHHPSYWRPETALKFRLPISPLLHADGERWFWLYKKLKTQTRLYTWGRGVKGNLGPARTLAGPRHLPRTRRMVHPRIESQWPTETDLPDEIGTIVDLQCGGWSTTVLNSDGDVYTVGAIDQDSQMFHGSSVEVFTRLKYLSQSTCRIRQISVGRRHILAIDDNNEILSWDRIGANGYKVFAKAARSFGGKPKRVVAGWGDSSAYIPTTGIVIWPLIKNDQSDQFLDGVHVKETIIPETARKTHRVSEKDVTVEPSAHILLEGYVVWITSLSEIFACKIDQSDLSTPELEPEQDLVPFKVPGYTAAGRELKDIQGSFRTFVVFTASGDVLAGNTTYLDLFVTAAQDAGPETTPDTYIASNPELLSCRPSNIPALQNTGVIQVAFGDHHYHALHANGTLTSYGTESQGCGSFGLGDESAGSYFRGVYRTGQGMRPDLSVMPAANNGGRQVWFEPEKKDWLRWLQDHRPPKPAKPPQIVYSEWVEQEGRHWADGPLANPIPHWGSGDPEVSKQQSPSAPPRATEPNNNTYDNLPAYFAIAVAAAGWHSGALVLVDEAQAEAVQRKWTVSRPAQSVPGEFEAPADVHEEYIWTQHKFPRIQLPAGLDDHTVWGVDEATSAASNEPVRAWRDSVPTLGDLRISIADTQSVPLTVVHTDEAP